MSTLPKPLSSIEDLKELLNKPNPDRDKMMIHFRFMHEVEQLMKEQRMTKKEFAKRLGKSASYITQLFTGDKTLNLDIIAKIEPILNVKFDVQAKTDIGEAPDCNLPEFPATMAWNYESIFEKIINAQPAQQTIYLSYCIPFMNSGLNEYITRQKTHQSPKRQSAG